MVPAGKDSGDSGPDLDKDPDQDPDSSAVGALPSQGASSADSDASPSEPRIMALIVEPVGDGGTGNV